MLARVNVLREEPGGATRLFVNDLNGPLYILDKNIEEASRPISTSTAARVGRGCSTSCRIEAGYANGFISFQFDPDYRRNGKFYTVHIEDPSLPGSKLPDSDVVRGLNVAGYTDHAADRRRPATIQRESVADRVDRHEHRRTRRSRAPRAS